MLASLLLVGCGLEPMATDEVPASATPRVSAIEGVPKVALVKSDLEPKGLERMLNELSQGLEIDAASTCMELYDEPCATLHRVPLGGVDPYHSSVYEPLEASITTSPVSADRVVLHACIERVDLDAENPDGSVLFGELFAPIDEQRHRSEILAEIVTGLTRRAFLRDPSDAELAEYLAFYDTASQLDGHDPARSWAIGTCLAIYTSAESLFY